jgi:hypothetical protein
MEVNFKSMKPSIKLKRFSLRGMTPLVRSHSLLIELTAVGTTLAWLYYELFKHPHIQKKLRAELNEVFGAEVQDREGRAASKILADRDEVISKLVFTTACIKETLRMHPRVSSFRYSPPGTGFTITHNGKTYDIDNYSLVINQRSIQRDKRVRLY